MIRMRSDLSHLTRFSVRTAMKLLIVLLIAIPKSHSLKVIYTSETVKKNSSNNSSLLGSAKLAEEVLRSKYGHAAPTLTTVYLNAASNYHALPPTSTQPSESLSGAQDGGIKKVKDWNKVVVGVIIFTATFAILIMTLSKMLETKVEESQDQFLKNAVNMCFKQIALIGMINLVLWLVLHTKIATRLDRMIFHENKMQPGPDGSERIVEPIFECLLAVSVILLAWYMVYVLYFQFIVKRIISWMRRADNSDVLSVSKDLDFLDREWFSALLHPLTIKRGRFLANRFEFIETINSMSYQSVFRGGYYFMEYLRANLLDVSMRMLRFPREVLVFVIVLSVILRNTLNFDGRNEVIAMSAFGCLCALTMVLLAVYVHSIELKLYPPKLSQYLAMRYNANDLEIARHPVQALLPPYKLAEVQDEPQNFLVRFVHGYGPVNKHENLFLFKSKGPQILLKVFEVACFSFLFVLSIWVYLVQQHQKTWLNRFAPWNALLAASLAVVVVLIPQILYSLIVVSKTGLLIDLDTVKTVWNSHLANNWRHGIELVEALNVDAVASSLDRNGELYWRHLLARLKTSPLGVQKQMGDVWKGLDSGSRGEVPAKKIVKYISSQGLQITGKKAKEFVKLFARTQPNKLTEEEFLVLGLVIKQVMASLDTPQMKVLFEEVYGIPWSSPSGINPDTLQSIVKHLGLKWSEGDRRHLLDFLHGGSCDSMSAQRFVEQLASVEELVNQGKYRDFELDV